MKYNCKRLLNYKDQKVQLKANANIMLLISEENFNKIKTLKELMHHELMLR